MHPFIHLHVHSQFSVLDGQASVPALVDKAIENGMPGIALTDHGNHVRHQRAVQLCQ